MNAAVTGADRTRTTLRLDEMEVLAGLVGVAALPVVLGLRPRDLTEDALRALTSRGIVRGRTVAEPVEKALLALDRPDRELAMRVVTPDGMVRSTVVRRAEVTVSVERTADFVVVDVAEGRTECGEAVDLLMRSLPRSSAAEITPVGAPLDQFSEALAGTHDPTEMTDRIRALGADARAALLLGSALGSRLAFAEIVCYTLDIDDGRIHRGRAAVAVFYTKRGRIVAAPSVSPSGQVWTTFKGGSDHAIRQALSLLVEMSAESWEDVHT